MAHYAFLDANNIVVDVIVGRDENDSGVDWEAFYSQQRGLRCLRTSYNTFANQHRHGGTPLRGNYAGIGFSYDAENDLFVPPQPYASWRFDATTASWLPPISQPTTGGPWVWSEVDLVWRELNRP